MLNFFLVNLFLWLPWTNNKNLTRNIYAKISRSTVNTELVHVRGHILDINYLGSHAVLPLPLGVCVTWSDIIPVPLWTIFGNELSVRRWAVSAMFPPSIIEDYCVDLRRSMCRRLKIDDRCEIMLLLAQNIDTIVVCELRRGFALQCFHFYCNNTQLLTQTLL